MKDLTLEKVVDRILHGNISGVLRYRLVRTVSLLVLGAGLGVSGLTMQFSLRNPLADPYLLGVSSGASLGIVALISYSKIYNPTMIYGVALLSGIVAFLIVIGIGASIGGSPSSLIVSGVSVSYALTGLTILLFIKNMNKLNLTFIWLFGTVAYVIPDYLYYTIIFFSIFLLLLIVYSEKINTLILGDDVSESMGINVKRTRYIALISSGSIAAIMVAMAGPVGFIGLAAPWSARLIHGSNYRLVLFTSMLIGANLSLFSDIMVRLIGGSQELPLTAFTALFGGPILFYLTRKTGW